MRTVLPGMSCWIVCCLLTVLSPHSVALSEPQTAQTEIELRGANPMRFADQDELIIGQSSYSPFRDMGELLREMPGVSGGRMGGHGVEPVIRGQSQTQLNVTSDGSYTFGACPNRMDPPASYSVTGDDTRVKVERGYQSVTRGPGGPGGAVSIVHERPGVDSDKPLRGTFSSRYGSNGDLAQASGAMVYSEKEAFLRGQGFYQDSGNYKDGNGDSVRSAFSSYGGLFDGGLDFDQNTGIRLGVERVSIDDALYAGAGMDAPRSDSTVVKLGIDHTPQTKLEQALKLSFFGSLVDHLMDNYSLREKTAGFMRAPSESDTYGGRFLYSLKPVGHEISLGLDLLNNNKNARGYMSMTNPDDVNSLQTILWPDISVRDLGFFSEDRYEFSTGTSVTAGLRYDRVQAEIEDAQVRPGGSAMGGMAVSSMMPLLRTPEELYQHYYGVSADRQDENNWGGILKAEQELGRSVSVFAKYSRVMRTADPTERAIARSVGADNWIGNPALDPERHNEAEIGVLSGGKIWNAALSLYNDDVQNYILRDHARGTDGILQSDGATVYRNIQAQLAGTEVSGDVELDQNWKLQAAAFYTWAEDSDRSKPLAQIPPLQGALRLYHLRESWKAGLVLRAASRQGRVDMDPTTGAGRDVRKTPGWGVLDLTSSVRIAEKVELRFGVLNIFGRNYADHLNRSSLFDPEEIQVNEPGRELFAQVIARL